MGESPARWLGLFIAQARRRSWGGDAVGKIDSVADDAQGFAQDLDLPPPRRAASSSAIRSRLRSNRAKAAAQAHALRPHIERCIEAGRTSSSSIETDLNARGIAALNGGRWFL
jgi:hypothetical protein